MITLYQFATSPFAEKVRRALAYKQIEYAVHEVDRTAIGGGAYAGVSPNGKFPVIDHDGTIVGDSTDIIHYLEASFPEPPLLPGDRRDAALAHVIEDWADESLYFYEMTMRLAWAHNLDAALDEFSKGLPNIPRDALRQSILDGVGALTTAQGLGRKPPEKIVTDIVRHFTALNDMLATDLWLAGEALSLADLAVVAQVNALLYAVEARDALEHAPNLKAWMVRVGLAAPSQSKSH